MATCNRTSVRIAPKHVTAARPHLTSARSPHTSFTDTLACASARSGYGPRIVDSSAPAHSVYGSNGSDASHINHSRIPVSEVGAEEPRYTSNQAATPSTAAKQIIDGQNAQPPLCAELASEIESPTLMNGPETDILQASNGSSRLTTVSRTRKSGHSTECKGNSTNSGGLNKVVVQLPDVQVGANHEDLPQKASCGDPMSAKTTPVVGTHGFTDSALTTDNAHDIGAPYAIESTKATEARNDYSAQELSIVEDSASISEMGGCNPLDSTSGLMPIAACNALGEPFDSMQLPSLGGGNASSVAGVSGNAVKSQRSSGTLRMDPSTTSTGGIKYLSSNSMENDPYSGLHGLQSIMQSLEESRSNKAAVVIKPAESSTVLAAAIAVHVSPSQSNVPHDSKGGADAGALGTLPSKDPQSDQTDGSFAAGAQGINTARIIESMSETEMRLGMHSSEFGDIAIRTSISQQHMQAQISVAHSDLGFAISAHIPQLESQLGHQLGLHASFDVQHTGASLSNGQGQGSQHSNQPHAGTVTEDCVALATECDPLVIPMMPSSAGELRLDIRA